MLLKDADLAAHCRKNGLLPIYWIAGDDALQRQEAADTIRVHAKKLGYQREILTITASFSWDNWIQKIDHFDLFSEYQLIELHHPSGKWDAKAQAAFQHFFHHAPKDKSLLLISHQLTASQKNAKLTQQINQQGALVWLWPPNRSALPKWIETRLQQNKLTADKQAIALLAQYSEGDLSTAQQAIEKLVLLQPNLPVSAKIIQALISDHANYSAFDCIDSALAGQPKRCLRILSGLQFTNQEPTFILWTITQQIQILYRIRRQLDQGVNLKTAFTGQWESRHTILKAALKRLSIADIRNCLTDAFQVDLNIKGVGKREPWQLLENLCLKLAAE
jgi:DNA polymerase-3 subunit delta